MSSVLAAVISYSDSDSDSDSSDGEDKLENTQPQPRRGMKRKAELAPAAPVNKPLPKPSAEIQSSKVSERRGSTAFEFETFSFVWSIANITALLADSERQIPSPIFRGGDKSNHKWRLCLKTKAKIDNADYLGLYLELTSFGDGNNDAERKIKVRYELSILDVIKGVPEKRAGGFILSAKEFSQKGNWGTPKFLDCKLLSGNTADRYIKDDVMKISCQVWIEGDFRLRTVASGSYQDMELLSKRNNHELVSNLKDLLLDHKSADVAITTPTQTIMAHKAILSGRSSVFRAMLNAPMVESVKNTINIMDFDARVVTGMLDYIYTGETSDLNAIAGDLLQIAEKYDLKGLKDTSELALSENLTVYNSVQVLVLADLHNAATLKANVLDFIKRNVSEVQKTAAFQEVVQSNKDLILEIFLSNKA